MTGEGSIEDVIAGRARWNVTCGDSSVVVPTLPDGCINVTVTSPPYNQMTSLESKPTGMWAKTGGGLGMVRAWQASGYADNMPEGEYQQWQRALFSELSRATAPDGSLFYNHQLRWRDGECLHPLRWFTPDGWNLRTEIIWDRCRGMMMNARMFYRADERVFWFCRGGAWKWNQSHVGFGTVWHIASVQQQGGDKEHPVQFPIEIPDRCIGATTDVDDVVLDLFCGSGTSLVSAIRLGRRAIGIERDPKWAALSRDRLRAEESNSTLAASRAGQVPLFGVGT